jgi:hypothetical protein
MFGNFVTVDMELGKGLVACTQTSVRNCALQILAGVFISINT